MKLASVFLILTFVFSSAHAEIRYTAMVYALDDKEKKNLLYNYKSESEYVGETAVVNNRFTYPDGRLASHEEITFLKDKSISHYKQQQEQIHAEGTIEVSGGKAKLTWIKDGKEKSTTVEAGPDFIIGTQIPLQLEDNWVALMKGEKLKRRLAILDRLDTFGFVFSKDGETEINGQKVVNIKMKPSSFIIAAVVSPLHFFMTPDGTALVQIQGRTTVKKDVAGKMKDLDALIDYKKGSAFQTPAVPASPTPKSGGNSK